MPPLKLAGFTERLLLLLLIALHPSNMLVHLSDGFAHTIVCAATPR